MNEKKTVTVAGVPVTIVVVGRELAIQVGRFDPQAAAGRLRVSPLSGTAAVAVYVAGECAPPSAATVTCGTRPEVTSDDPAAG